MADESTEADEGPAEEPKYDQAFFLALAAKGKDAWNAWRRDPANKAVRVTFAGIDFSEAPRDRIDFSGFEFGVGADFSGCKWRGVKLMADTNAFTPGRAFFTGAAFGDSVNFAGADFGSWANFTGAAFGNEANFTGAFFYEGAIFTGAAFGWGAKFHDATFIGWVVFIGIPEEEKNRFLTISFESAHFDGAADFSGRSFQQVADFTGARFYYPPDFDTATNVGRIDFTGAHIGFGRPGKLHWTSKSEVPVRLRAFRKIAEETKNHDLERDLYIEERKAERGVYWRQLSDELKKAPEQLKKNLEDINKQKKHVWLEWRLQRKARNAHRLGIAVNVARLAVHGFWIAVMGFYWALADYGRSFARPFAWLIASGFFFYWRYDKILAPLMPQAGTPDAAKYEHAVGMLALGNTVPFVGPLTIDGEIKKFLFCLHDTTCSPIPPEGFQFLVLGQNLLSIILVFFIGLALRNYFRIK